MEDETINDKIELSKKELFRIFLKTGRKRVGFSIAAGIIVFLAITSLCMVIYSHRFTVFQEYQTNNIDWYNDGYISASTNLNRNMDVNFTDNLIANFTANFRNTTEQLIPNLKIANTTSAMSAQQFRATGNPIDPWLYFEFMAPDNRTYEALSRCLVEGRMPLNSSELIYYQNELFDYPVNSTLILNDYQSELAPIQIFTIVGVVEDISETFQKEHISQDLFDWSFDSPILHNYYRLAVFFTNYTNLQSRMNNLDYYFGTVTYLVDYQYDCSALKINDLRGYVESYPTDAYRIMSEVTLSHVLHAPDLKRFIIDFSNYWIEQYSIIIGINAPLLFIVGLISVVTLSIGSKDLAATFRRMKLYGLNYRVIRQMIFLENLIFTFVSFIGGTLIGYLISYLFTRQTPNQPFNYYLNSVQEPLLLISLTSFIIGFFTLSFYLQNSIAKKTVGDSHQEYQKKRRKIRNMLSTNEFRLFVVTLLFTLVTVILYVLYTYVGPNVPMLSSFSYLTFFWFMITCSIAFMLTFLFLIIARVITLLWTLLNNRLWRNRLNIFTLSIKHLSDNRGIYQTTILAALIFGLVIIPGLAMESSIPLHLQNEAKLSMGNTNLIVTDWFDQYDTILPVVNNISGVQNATEVRAYSIGNDNQGSRYPRPFQIYMLGIKKPTEFIETIDFDLFDESIDTDDLTLLNNLSFALFDSSVTQKYNINPGEVFGTSRYSRYVYDFTSLGSFDFFPLTPLSKKQIFSDKDALSIVTSLATAKEFIYSLDFSTDIYGESFLLIKTANQSSVQYVKNQLDNLTLDTMTMEDYYNEYYAKIELFPKNNLFFFSFMVAFTLLFIGYFTGMKIFDDRIRIIESFYRIGAERGRILGLFTMELFFVNILPITIAMLGSIPFVRLLAVYYLNVQEYYIHFELGMPAWLFIVIILGGIVLSTIGWFLAIIPALYRYRPVKQE
ncbi:MAG: FtsX-like permease family protein [Candidatus Heimdallarchaeota archaeon]